MARLFHPDSDQLSKAGFGSVAHVPVIFHNGYCREANRYLREFSAGFDAFEEKRPCQKTLINSGHYLGNILSGATSKVSTGAKATRTPGHTFHRQTDR